MFKIQYLNTVSIIFVLLYNYYQKFIFSLFIVICLIHISLIQPYVDAWTSNSIISIVFGFNRI